MTREEAIKILSERYSSALFSERTAMETLIPELKESEDEKARKWIYDYIHNCPNESFEFYGGIGKRAVLAWLEKQKDSVSNTKYIEDVAHAFEDGRKKGIEEKQKEPENVSASTMIPSCWEEEQKDNKFAPRVLPCSAAWFEDCEEKQKEPDGIWTEEDDAKVKAMCEEGDLKPSEIAWLKELKNRIVKKEQKPLEYLPKEKVYHIMRELSILSLSDIIPIESEEYKKIDEITSDVRDLLDYPIEQKPAEWVDDVIRKGIKEVGLTQYQINWLKSNVFSLKNTEHKQCIYGDTPSVERCAVCSARCDTRVREEDKQKEGSVKETKVSRVENVQYEPGYFLDGSNEDNK